MSAHNLECDFTNMSLARNALFRWPMTHGQTLLIYDKSLNIRHMSYINFKKCRKLTP
jgi:hypothetical protein